MSHCFYGQEIWVVQAQGFSVNFSQAVDQDKSHLKAQLGLENLLLNSLIGRW